MDCAALRGRGSRRKQTHAVNAHIRFLRLVVSILYAPSTKAPLVRPCELPCALLQREAASLPKRTIVGRFRAVLGKLPVRRNRSRRKGRGRARPHPGHFCPQCGQFHGVCHRGRRTVLSAGGGVENRKSSAIAGKLAGSQLNFKEKSVVFAAQKLTRHRQRIGLAELITFS